MKEKRETGKLNSLYMSNEELLQIIDKYKTISIIGMSKNVGKTTVLNYIIDKTKGERTLGLTSIGRDGEDIDSITFTGKPKIYVKRGTLIATAKQCLLSSDITREILRPTGINTPLGEIIICRALSSGQVELAGPAINSQMTEVCSLLQCLGSEKVIIDGALSRKSTAALREIEATILATGASVSNSMDKVMENTKYTVRLLSMESEKDENILSLKDKIFEISKLGIINKDRNVKKINVPIAMGGWKDIVENLDESSEYVAVKGIISGRMMEQIMKTTDRLKQITFLIEDGTKLFIEQEILDKFEKTGGKIKVSNPINIICITCNPASPFGYEFDKNIFLQKMRESIDLPVFDVLGGV